MCSDLHTANQCVATQLLIMLMCSGWVFGSFSIGIIADKGNLDVFPPCMCNADIAQQLVLRFWKIFCSVSYGSDS